MRRLLPLLVMLLALANGVQALAPMLGIDGCSELEGDCPDETDEGCDEGPCVFCVCCSLRVRESSPSVQALAPRSQVTAPSIWNLVEPALPLSGSEIFHPPKA